MKKKELVPLMLPFLNKHFNNEKLFLLNRFFFASDVVIVNKQKDAGDELLLNKVHGTVYL